MGQSKIKWILPLFLMTQAGFAADDVQMATSEDLSVFDAQLSHARVSPPTPVSVKARDPRQVISGETKKLKGNRKSNLGVPVGAQSLDRGAAAAELPSLAGDVGGQGAGSDSVSPTHGKGKNKN